MATFSNVTTATRTSSGSTLQFTSVTANIGDWLIVVVAADNSGTSGVSAMSSGGISDSDNNSWTNRVLANRTAGTANDGATIGIWTTQVTDALSSGTITVSFSPNVTRAAGIVYKAVPASGKAIKYRTVSTASTGSSYNITHTTASITNGDTVICGAAVETYSALGGDSDTTNGNWSTIYGVQSSSGTHSSSMSVGAQYKTVTATATQAWNPTWGTTSRDYAINSFSVYEVLNVTTGYAEETDTAYGLSRTKIRSVGMAEETDSSLTLGRVKPKATGLASETDSAYALAFAMGFYLPIMFPWGRTPLQVATGRADETDTAYALSYKKVVSTGLAAETDTAFTIGKAKPTGRADETDSAFDLGRTKIKSIGFSEETDSSYSLSITKVYSTGLASETDSAYSFSITKIRAVGLAEETDTAIQLALAGLVAVQAAEETDTALALSRAKLYSTGRSDETDSAYSLGRLKIRAAGIAEETDTAITCAVSTTGMNPGLFPPFGFLFGSEAADIIAVDYATETDTAYALTSFKIRAVGLASETDTAYELGLGAGVAGLFPPLGLYFGGPAGAKYFPAGRADETDTAYAVTLVRSPTKLMIRWAQETPISYSLSRRKIRSYGIATSTNTAFALRPKRVYTYGFAEETDLAIAPTLGIVGSVTPAVEIDTALPLVRRKIRAVGMAESLNEALVPQKSVVATGLATETDTAFSLSVSELRRVGIATETDVSITLRIAHIRHTGVAGETDTALALSSALSIPSGIATSFNTSFGLTLKKLKLIGVASETDTARQLFLVARPCSEIDNACFFEIKQNGEVVFPPVVTVGQRRMWPRFVS